MKIKNVLKKALKYVLMPCALVGSIIGIYTINANAYYLDSDNNLVSNNVANLETLNSVITNSAYTYNVTNQVLTLTSNNTTSDPYIYFRDFITLKANTIYSMYVVVNNQFQYCGLTSPSNSTNVERDLDGVRSIYQTGNSAESYGFGFEGLQNTSYEVKIMIYEGNFSLDWEPYGIWWNEEAYEHQKYLASITNINQLFNGASVELIGTGDGTLASGTLLLYNDRSVLSYSDLPSNIRNYISSHSSIDFEINITLPHQTNVSLYLNSNYNNIACAVRHDINNVNEPINSNYYLEFNSSFNTTNYLINPTFSYNWLSIYYINTTNNNFNISISNDNYFYRDGYNDGYNKGNTAGYENGYNTGRIDGYNSGYNEGANSNLETNGMKTLFNSILSYPVNMIRSVFNFEFMGVNIASVIMFVISIGIVIFVIRKFKE